ncbi:methyltransferase domain-containing protein [Arthrobacter sp. UYEF3]|uniref:methyltransferase domain-containing protein n=1 Tax=Arthrobacter sp. UYEF3 TaxID=1756365 RepID=UPI00339999CC
MLRTRAVDAVEEMDRPDCDPARLARTYAQFAAVNRAVSGWRGIYRHRLRPLLSAETATTLLDIGCGGGDVAVLLSRWAARDGLRLAVTAIDPDPRAAAFAAHRRRRAGVTFRRQSSAELLRDGERFDVVVSNHVLHHLRPAELTGFLTDSAALSAGTVIHNDLRRSAAAFALFSAGALPFRGSYIRKDGLTSIRRSYTMAELRDAAPPGWTVLSRSPYRNLLILDKAHGPRSVAGA